MNKVTKYKDVITRVPVSVNATAGQHLIENASPRMDLSYKLVSNISLNDQSLHRSIFRGTIFRDVKFENIDLSRGDFQAARFERCNFTNCNFTVSDFKACDFGKVTFSNCDLSSTSITDCQFTQVKLVGCSFELAHFMNCDVSKSLFERTKLSKGAHVLNYYSNTIFRHMHLADCTFDKHIFHNCEFDNCDIAVIYLGLILGITAADLQKMRLIYQDKDSTLDEPSSEIMKIIMEEYQNRGMYLSAAIFKLNYGLYSNKYSAFLDIRDVIIGNVRSNLILNKEEIIFLERLLNHYHKLARLPLLVIIDYYRQFNKLLKSIPQAPSNEITSSAIGALIPHLASILHEMLLKLDESLHDDFILGKDVPIYLRVTFKTQPNIDIAPLINQLTQKAGFGNYNKTKSIDSYVGSYVEILRTGTYALSTFCIVLYLLNGMLKQFNGVLKQAITTLDSTSLIVSKYRKVKNQIVNNFALNAPSKIMIPVDNLYDYLSNLDRDHPLFSDEFDIIFFKKMEIETSKEKLGSSKKNRIKTSARIKNRQA